MSMYEEQYAYKLWSSVVAVSPGCSALRTAVPFATIQTAITLVICDINMLTMLCDHMYEADRSHKYVLSIGTYMFY